MVIAQSQWNIISVMCNVTTRMHQTCGFLLLWRCRGRKSDISVRNHLISVTRAVWYESVLAHSHKCLLSHCSRSRSVITCRTHKHKEIPCRRKTPRPSQSESTQMGKHQLGKPWGEGNAPIPLENPTRALEPWVLAQSRAASDFECH